MHPNALLDLATDLLREVLKLDRAADQVVSDYFRRHKALGIRERHALAETTYHVLRQRLLLTHLAQSGHGALERRLALLGWQGGAGLLRGAIGPQEQKWLDDVHRIDPQSYSEKLRHNLPDWLAQAVKEELGDGDAFWDYVRAINTPAPLDLRVNTLKSKTEDARAALQDAGITSEPTPYSPMGLRIYDKPPLQKTNVFIRGDVEVQDEGSQMLALLTNPKRGEMVVDFCAGAGGKTLALGAAMRNTGRLYAFDVSGYRLDKLKPRLARSGLSNVYPAQIAHERDDRIKRLAGKIDRVLVDAPCSGLGTLRRNPDLKWRQSPKAIAAMTEQQGAILASAARLLKEGGRLVYATCSPLRREDEDIADAFSAANPAFVRVPAAEALVQAGVDPARAAELDSGGNFRSWPHLHRMDGFFAAVWQKS